MGWLSGIAGAALGMWSANKSAGAQAALSREQMQWQSQEAQKTRDWRLAGKNVVYGSSA